jgi:NADH:ubiquinone oxidoreductase subunit E
LNLSRAEVHGVVSFYHDYRESPAGRHVIKLCRAEACQSMGGDELAERLMGLLGLDWHETSADRASHHRTCVLPRPLRLRTGGDGRWRGARQA